MDEAPNQSSDRPAREIHGRLDLGTFDAALRASTKCDGIGFVFSPDDPYCGVDLDDCRNPDTCTIEEWACEILRELDSYSEVSPSGSGVKVIVRGRCPAGGNRRGHVEMYDHGRYFALTGRALEGTGTIENRQSALDAVHARLIRPPKPASGHPNGNGHQVQVADQQLLDKMFASKNGSKIRGLWTGDISAYGGDDSVADLALCGHLAFWTGPHPEQIDSLFRQSGLMREKWNREDYRSRTIGKALEGRTEFYGERKQKQKSKSKPKPMPVAEGDFASTDIGNGKRLSARHGAKLRFCHPWKKWLTWTGTRWAEDDCGAIDALAKETVLAIYTEAAESEEPERRMELAEHARKSEDAKRVAAMIGMARSEDGIPILPAMLDRDNMLLNVKNGTIDLRTGQSRPHDPKDYMTKLAPVHYNPDAVCPVWDRFLARIFDGNADLISYLQRVVGYSLTGSVAEQCLWFFHGAGANGKSTFLGAILDMMGDYGMQAVSDLLMMKHGEQHPTEKADLFGRRFVATIETEDGRKMAESLTKQLTGGDKIRARRMREDFWEFDPTFKMFLAANHKPVVRGQDYAIWRRIKLVPFNVTIDDAEKDKHLPAKLKAELPGILAWAVRGCLDWQQNGLGEPDEVRMATDQYRSEMDVISVFLSECCLLNPEWRCRGSALWDRFQKWLKESGENVHTMNHTRFGQELKKRFTDSKNNGVWYLGVRLAEATEGPEAI